MRFQGKHVFITGGSAGIGFAVAKECLKRGAKVSLVARNLDKLKASKEELTTSGLATEGSVFVYSADVTDPQKVSDAVAAATAALGPIDAAICNAGSATPGYFHRQDISVFRDTMELNYFGVLNTVRAVYSDMVKRGSGHICLVSSALAVLGLTGYTAYGASKAAVRGLAEGLRNEVQGTGVTVSLCMPPDTSTPGFDAENEVKPIETHKIAESSSVFPPEQVAKLLVQGIEKDRFYLACPDFGLNLHYGLMQGLVPRRFLTLIRDVLVGWFGPIIQHFVAAHHDSIARQYAGQRFEDLTQ